MTAPKLTEALTRLLDAAEAVRDENADRSRHECAGWDCATCQHPSTRAELDEAIAAGRAALKEGGE